MKKFLFATTLLIAFAASSQYDKDETTVKFEEVFGYLESNYVAVFNGSKITDAAIVAM